MERGEGVSPMETEGTGVSVPNELGRGGVGCWGAGLNRGGYRIERRRHY